MSTQNQGHKEQSPLPNRAILNPVLVVSEPKIAGLSPRWAPFPGFSLLFDAPDGAYRREGAVEILDAGEEGEFFGGLREGMAALNPDLLLQTYGLCPLPPSSYHVTAFDAANVAHLPTCRAESRDALRTLLDRVPSYGGLDDPLLASVAEGELARTAWDLEFEFAELVVWSVLAVRLRPVDEAAFARFVAARAELSRRLRAEHGFGAGERFTPHISLGYFANPPGAELARARLPAWDAAMRERLNGARLSFPTASLHGFTSMATFFRSADGV